MDTDCIACGSSNVDEEVYGLRCYDCGYVHPADDADPPAPAPEERSTP